MKNILTAGFAIVIILTIVNLYFTFNKPQKIKKVEPTPSPATQQSEFVIPNPPDTSALKAGGSSYTDTQNVFTFLYPNDYKIDHQEGDKYTRVYKNGPTQKGQTEMYDGVIVNFERVDLAGKTLAEWVDTQMKMSQDYGVTEVSPEKKSVVLNGYNGFSYELKGLGTFTNIVVQKDASSPYAVALTTLVADPTSKGFQKEVDMIFSTLELRK